NDRTYFNFNATLVQPAQVSTLAQLNAYDAVVIGNNGYVSGDPFDNAAFTAALRQWVEAGHGLVAPRVTVYGAGASSGTPVADIDAIVPVDTSGVSPLIRRTNLVPGGVYSPVTAEVPSFPMSDFVEYAEGGVDSGAMVLATMRGQPTVVTGRPGGVG